MSGLSVGRECKNRDRGNERRGRPRERERERGDERTDLFYSTLMNTNRLTNA